MTKQPVDEKKILDYLLGILPEAETESLDEMSLADNDFAARLDTAENELVDSYARGELSGDALAAFQAHYLASPRRRQKAAFAQTFRGALQNRQVHALPNGVSALAASYSRSRFLPAQWAIAAAVSLMILAGGYLIVQNARLRYEVAQARSEQHALQQREQDLQGRLARQSTSGDETATELARVQERLKQLEQQLSGESPARTDVQLIAFNLSPQGRGPGKVPSLQIPKGTDLVVLSLELEVNDFPAYQAALKDPQTGGISWRGKASPDGQGNSLLVAVPAGVLKSQIYLLELSGISASGAREAVGDYPFRVLVQ